MVVLGFGFWWYSGLIGVDPVDVFFFFIFHLLNTLYYINIVLSINFTLDNIDNYMTTSITGNCLTLTQIKDSSMHCLSFGGLFLTLHEPQDDKFVLNNSSVLYQRLTRPYLQCGEVTTQRYIVDKLSRLTSSFCSSIILTNNDPHPQQFSQLFCHFRYFRSDFDHYTQQLLVKPIPQLEYLRVFNCSVNDLNCIIDRVHT